MRPNSLIFLLAVFALPLVATAQPGATVRFVALGDAPYGTVEDADRRYRALIDRINVQEPAFSIHVGDFKKGRDRCDEAFMRQTAGYFDRFEAGVLFTLGDNDWTDCTSGHGPRTMLERWRAEFFGARADRWAKGMTIRRQSAADLPDAVRDPRMVENVTWKLEEVRFATIHVVGSDNNEDDPDEREQREKANADWVRATFDTAREERASAVVIAMHAEIYDSDDRKPFKRTRKAIRDGAGGFDGPVLLIMGDKHDFKTCTPARDGDREIRNATHLRVPGEHDMGAIIVTVDPDNRAQPFQLELIEAPG